MVIDIIIPFYNAQRTISNALASIVTQKLDKGDTLITTIVNDASTEVSKDDMDNLGEFWNNLLDLQIINCEVNGGAGVARQAGMDETDGDLIMFMDADDVLGSPFAVRTLAREMKKTGNDIVMGQFVEEAPGGIIVNHEENYVWLHGKMFKRSFIEKHSFRFNNTRYNEDVGFLSLLSQFTDKRSYIHQVVYIWQNQKDSTVRTDRDLYAYGFGFRGFVGNLAWASEEMQARKLNKGISSKFSLECLCRLYWQELDANNNLPNEAEENDKAIKDFYKRAVKPFADDGAIDLETIAETYQRVNAEWTPPCTIPTRTFRDFLRMAGFKERKK